MASLGLRISPAKRFGSFNNFLCLWVEASLVGRFLLTHLQKFASLTFEVSHYCRIDLVGDDFDCELIAKIIHPESNTFSEHAKKQFTVEKIDLLVAG